MKKMLKKMFVSLLAGVMLFSTLSFTAAAETGEAAGEWLMFLAYGGDSEGESWDMCWANESDNASGIEATTAMAKEGDTVTIGLTMPREVANTWFMAPVLVAEGVGNVDYTIDKITLDGKDVTDTVDLSAGKSWWAEGTGNYLESEAVRLAGGYNEWADKYFAESPVGFTTIEYTITLNSITFGGAAGASELSTESYPAFIAFGGDISGENAWDAQYYGQGNAGNSEGATAVEGVLKNGETTTLSVTFPEEVIGTWFVAPCFVAEDASMISPESTFEVKMFLDGEEVAVDMSAGKSVWVEGTGDYTEETCLRIGGGYNEWADQYVEKPAGFKELTFEITPTIYVTTGQEEAPVFEFDANGTYHAYLGVQTPTWIFRNSFDDATYGLDSGFFNELGLVDGEWIAQGGSFTDAEIAGNGTYSVSMSGYDFTDQLGDDGLFNLLFLSTDLPMNDEVVISDITIKMDGKAIAEYDSAFLDAESKEYQKVLFANIWNNEIEAMPYYAPPTDSIEIVFTVSGFAYDNEAPAEEVPAETTPAETTPAETTPAETTSGGVNTTLIIVIVVIVVVIAVAAGVMVAKKKKDTK